MSREDLPLFNENVTAWNTTSVVDMSYMFDGARAFKQPIGSWNFGWHEGCSSSLLLGRRWGAGGMLSRTQQLAKQAERSCSIHM